MKHSHSEFSTVAAYSDQRAVETRVRSFLPMVRKAAWHIYGSGREGLEVEDLIQAGLVALTECARRHDGPSEDGFAAYAKMRVRGAMFDVLRKIAPDSRGAIRRQREIAQARAKCSGLHGRDPSIAELAEAMHTDVASVAAMDSDPLRIVSIDADYDESSAAFVDAEPDAFTRLVEAQDSARLASAVAKLPERLQLVLQLYFVDELNLSEIAETLEVSVPRVHQLKAGGLAKLREALGNQQP